MIGKAFSLLNTVMSSSGARRKFTGVRGKIISGFAIVIALYHIYIFTIGTFEPYPHRAIHLGSILALCYLTMAFYPETSNRSRGSNRLPIIDLILALFSLGIMTYLAVNWHGLTIERYPPPMSPGSLSALEIFLGIALIVLLLEAGRRMMGNWLGLIIIVSVIYALVGPHLGGLWHHRGFNITQVVDFTVYSIDGIFSEPIGVSSTYIILFVIFGSLVQYSGVGQFFSDVACALAGRTKGGPAKVAVVGSGFMGSITGSASANVATVGSFTIPMMKSIGFKPHFAGGVEAAASTGGHIMPPVMAGVVFIMSGITGIPYVKIAIASALPAILYYMGIFFQVHLYSVKNGIGGIGAGEKIPPILKTLKNGWQFLVPLIILVWLLMKGYSPIRACLWSMPTVVIVSWFRKDTRIGIRELLLAFESSVRTLRVIMLSCALSGILVGVVFYTGVSGKLIHVIRGFTGGMLLPALLLSAAMSLILGLPASLSASYILTAILVVPATVALGVPILAAHLFAIYFASVSVITPPTGGAFFVAAGMAGASPFATGWAALRLAFSGFIIPFFFVYKPALLLIGTPIQTVTVFVMAALAIFFMSAAIEGWLLTALSTPERGFLIVGGFLLIFMTPIQTGIGVALIAAVLIWQLRKRRGFRFNRETT